MRMLSLAAALAVASFCWGERNRTLPGKALAVPPRIDGVATTDEWAGAARTNGFVHLATGERTPFDVTVFAGFDANALYFAFVCPDPQPHLIRATEYRRGADLDGNDHVAVILNPFATFREGDANTFLVSAGGGMSAEFAEGRAAKREWEGEWEAKARVTDSGWECEIRIPWRILRLPQAGTRNIEVNFVRFIPRAQLAVGWCDLGADERFEYNGLWLDVEIPHFDQRPALLALPYQIAGFEGRRQRPELDAGMDLRYDFTPQITSLATLNPDFRNVEGAVLDLAFSRFERLADETRPFFVEGADEFRLGGFSARLFASQRLGGFDFGAKAFGKIGNRDSFGALYATRFGENSAALMRYRKSWGSRSGFTTGFVYWHDELQGLENTAGSFELSQMEGTWGAGLIYNFTSDGEKGFGERLDIDVSWRDAYSNATLGWQQFDSEFLPRIGFAPRVGHEGWQGRYEYRRQFLTGMWSEVECEAFFRDSKVRGGEGVFLRSWELSATGTTRGDLSLGTGAIVENFRGEEASFGFLRIEYPENDPYRSFELEHTIGSVDGQDYSLWSFGANRRFPFKLTLTPSLQFERLGSEIETQHVIGVSYELDAHRSLGGRAVIRDGKLNWYLAFRQSGNLGVEYYLILGNPNAESFERRIALKVVMPFELRP